MVFSFLALTGFALVLGGLGGLGLMWASAEETPLDLEATDVEPATEEAVQETSVRQ